MTTTRGYPRIDVDTASVTAVGQTGGVLLTETVARKRATVATVPEIRSYRCNALTEAIDTFVILMLGNSPTSSVRWRWP